MWRDTVHLIRKPEQPATPPAKEIKPKVKALPPVPPLVEKKATQATQSSKSEQPEYGLKEKADSKPIQPPNGLRPNGEAVNPESEKK